MSLPASDAESGISTMVLGTAGLRVGVLGRGGASVVDALPRFIVAAVTGDSRDGLVESFLGRPRGRLGDSSACPDGGDSVRLDSAPFELVEFFLGLPLGLFGDSMGCAEGGGS